MRRHVLARSLLEFRLWVSPFQKEKRSPKTHRADRQFGKENCDFDLSKYTNTTRRSVPGTRTRWSSFASLFFFRAFPRNVDARTQDVFRGRKRRGLGITQRVSGDAGRDVGRLEYFSGTQGMESLPQQLDRSMERSMECSMECSMEPSMKYTFCRTATRLRRDAAAHPAQDGSLAPPLLADLEIRLSV